MKGYVYILSNVSHPSILKIGMTTKSPRARAEELRGTGTLHPFIVEWSMECGFPLDIEQRAHSILWDKRVHDNREFFEVELDTAIDAIKLAEHYVTEEHVEEMARYKSSIAKNREDKRIKAEARHKMLDREFEERAKSTRNWNIGVGLVMATVVPIPFLFIFIYRIVTGRY